MTEKKLYLTTVLDPTSIAAIQAPILERLAALEARLADVRPPAAAEWLTPAEAAERTGLSDETIRRGVKSGQIPGLHVASAYRVSSAWCEGRAG